MQGSPEWGISRMRDLGGSPEWDLQNDPFWTINDPILSSKTHFVSANGRFGLI